MADWYVSSVNYNALPTFAASHAYNVGDIIRPTAPAAIARYPQRCTTAGTSGSSEPTWATSEGGTTTTRTATFTNVGGDSTYNWSAAAGSLASFTFAAIKNPSVGDRIFISSDHTEPGLAGSYSFGAVGTGVLKILSVNKAGSVPPVEADLTSGASITANATMLLDAICNIFWQGITFTSASGLGFQFNSNGVRQHYFYNCGFVFTGAGSAVINNNNPANMVFDNTPITFSAAGQSIAPGAYYLNFTWQNTPAALGGSTFPTTLFKASTGSGAGLATCRGVDLSALTGTLVAPATGTAGPQKYLFDSCRIASGATRYSAPTNATNAGDEVEFVNCYDGTHFLAERYTSVGTITTDFSTTFSGGASDDVGAYSHKLVSNTQSDISAMPLESFWFDVENTLTGASHTATVEIISSATLNNTDISLLLEYQGTAGSSVASFASSLSSTLAVASALPSSSGTWNNPPATPQKQHLAVTFTPQVAGRVRGRVRLGKPSTTVWVNPQITIT